MESKKVTKILIGGKIYTLRGYESEEYMQKVAVYLNNKLSDLSESQSYRQLHPDLRALMLTMNVADDYFKARSQAEVFEEDSVTKDREVYDLKNDLIASQIQLERLKEECEKLKAEKEELEKQLAETKPYTGR